MGSAAEGDKNAKGVCVQGSKDTRKEGTVGVDYVKSKRANNKMHKKNKHKKRNQSLAIQSVLRPTSSMEWSVVQKSRSVALRPLQLF